MIDLSFSIVNTSNWKFLEPCINSITTNVQNITYEILVVDNKSDDISPQYIKEKYPQVILTENHERYGFAKNNNINLRKSNGRYLMLLNDDTLVQPNSIEKAISFMDNNPQVGVVGCKMVNPDGSFQASSARRFRTITGIILSELGLSRKYRYNPILDRTCIPIHKSNTPIEIDVPQESGMIVRKEVVDQVGYLDERFFMFGEGPDWCRRIKQGGWKIVFLDECLIIHFGGATNRKTSLKMFLQSYKSTYLFFKKASSLKGGVFRLLIIVIYLMKYIFFIFQKLISKNRNSTMVSPKFSIELVKCMLWKCNDPSFPFHTN